MPGFRDIVGQTHIKNLLMRAVREGTVSHAYLLAGEEKAGKTFIARIFAQALLCERRAESGEPCGQCPSCKKVMADSHPDVRTVVHEKEGSIRVSEIIEQLVDDAYLTPYAAERKIYIVPDAHLITRDAQNKLLKTLEEPPSYVTILLLATGTDAMLPTIKSRCVPLPLRPVPTRELYAFLREQQGASEYKASLSARFARGNTGKAIAHASDPQFETNARAAMRLIETLRNVTVPETNKQMKAISSENATERETREEVLNIIRCLLRDLMVYKATGEKEHLILEEQEEYIRDTAATSTFRGLAETAEALRTARTRIEANVSPVYALELFFVKARDCLGGNT